MQVATNINGSGLGTFQQGVCASGADFICGPRGGIHSCRPCDFAQLEAFKDAQKKANQLVVSLGMSTKPAVITGERSCTGGYILAIDGRVGPCTVRTIAKIVRFLGPSAMPPISPLLGPQKFRETYEYIAKVIPELRTYFAQLIKVTNAPKDVPAPPQQPIKRIAAPGKVPAVTAPVTVLPDGTVVRPRVTRSGGLLVGGLVVLATIGSVGAGIYFKRKA